MIHHHVAIRLACAAAWCVVCLDAVPTGRTPQAATRAARPAAPGRVETPSARSGYVVVDGARLYYEVSGAGQPLVLIHGGLGSSVDFAKVLPDLARLYSVVTVDRRGHGRSSDSAAPYSYGSMAADVKAVLDSLSISSAVFLGFSDGAVVGLHLASSHPSLVRRLVAIAPSARLDGMDPKSVEAVRRTTVETLAAADPSIERTYRARSPNPEGFAAFVAKSREMWLRDPYVTPEQLAGIQAPVLLVAGEKDAVRLSHVLEMRALLRAGQLCVLPGATHFMLLEEPAVLLPVVLRFLRP